MKINQFSYHQVFHLSHLPSSNVWNIAEDVCSAQIDSSIPENVDGIWNALSMATRCPLKDGKTPVLVQLLCNAVVHPEIEKRRSFIERIMQLPKGTQKVLMSIIEQRRGKTPPRSSSKRKSSSAVKSASRSSASQPVSSPSQAETPRASANKSSNKSKHPQFDSSGYSPTPKKQLYTSPSTDSQAPFLSPGTMESPNKMQSVMQQMQSKVEDLVAQLALAQEREEALRREMEASEQQHKHAMMKVEATALAHQEDQQATWEEQWNEAQLELAKYKEQALLAEKATIELRETKDELDLLRHNKNVLADTTEKLRKFKEKMAELQTVREALEQEQEAHGKSIDEIVRLEAENQSLTSVKRQLDDYKIRAIEAEVKLVECQDYVRRMEQQVADTSATNENLYKGSLMQKEELDQLVSRIQKETEENVEDGIGAGLSELNPQVKEELVRLRNENLQLRAFQAKRQADSVEQMEEKLDDSHRLAEKYKGEYLSTKEKLASSLAKIEELSKLNAQLEVDLEEWQGRAEHGEHRSRVLEENLDRCKEQLEQTKQALGDSEIHNTNLQSDLEQLHEKFNESVAERNRINGLLEESNTKLAEMEALIRTSETVMTELQESEQMLEQRVQSLNDNIDQIEQENEELSEELKEALDLLTANKSTIGELEEQQRKLQTANAELVQDLDEMRSAREKERLDHESALERMSQEFDAQGRAELEALQVNMNRLLEDERRAYRQKDEESEERKLAMEQEWQGKFAEVQDRLASSLKQSRDEAQRRVDEIQAESRQEVEDIRRSAQEETESIIRKGRVMMNEAKAKAKEELLKLHGENQDLQNKLVSALEDKEELEVSLKQEITSLQAQVSYSLRQVNEMTNETDDLQDKLQKLEREKFKLQEDNDRYRNQLGGRYGTDGNVQSQFERLQKEYAAVLDENRRLKDQTQHSAQYVSDPSIGENSYGRSGASRTTYSQLRKEFEETIEALNDEKRELVMKNSAAITDVQKAEQRAWDREQENARLKGELTSMRLALQRAELARDHSPDNNHGHRSFSSENQSPREKSFYSARGDMGTPTREVPSPDRNPRTSRSPSIERAMKMKSQTESALRSKLSAMSGSYSPAQQSPPRPPTRRPTTSADEASAVLSPTSRHDQAANLSGETPSESETRDAGSYGIDPSGSQHRLRSANKSVPPQRSVWDRTKLDTTHDEGKQECNQS